MWEKIKHTVVLRPRITSDIEPREPEILGGSEGETAPRAIFKLCAQQSQSRPHPGVAAALLVKGELFGGRVPRAEGRGSGAISEPAQGFRGSE